MFGSKNPGVQLGPQLIWATPGAARMLASRTTDSERQVGSDMAASPANVESTAGAPGRNEQRMNRAPASGWQRMESVRDRVMLTARSCARQVVRSAFWLGGSPAVQADQSRWGPTEVGGPRAQLRAASGS